MKTILPNTPSKKIQGERIALYIFIFFIIFAVIIIIIDNYPFQPPETLSDRKLYQQGITTLRKLETAVKQYRKRTGLLPKNLKELVPDDIPKIPRDPWGRDYRYFSDGAKAELRFLGRDGELGPAPHQVDRDVITVIK